MTGLATRLWFEEAGQDLVEYAFLASFVGLSCIAVFDVLRESIRTTYQSWNTETNNLWSPPPPSP